MPIALVRGLLLAALAGAPAVHAQSLELSWQAPPECASESEVLARLRSSLPAAPLPVVRAEVTRRGPQLVLQLAIEHEGRSVTRELRASDCGALVAGIATLVGLALGAQTAATEPEAAAEVRPPEPAAATPLPAVEPVLAAPVMPAAPSRPAAPQRWRLRAAVGAGLQAAGLPTARPALLAKLGVQYAALSLDVRVGHVFAATRALSDNASLRFVSQFAALSACGQWGTRDFTGGPCLSLQGTRVRVSSSGLEAARDRNTLWAQLGLGAGARYGFAHRAELGLEAGVLLPLSARPQFRVDGRVDPVAEGDLLSGYGHFELGVRFQ